MSWKNSLATAVAVSALAVLVPAGSASAAKPVPPGPETAVPAECWVSATGFTRKGEVEQATYDGTSGQASLARAGYGRWPFVPTAYVSYGGYGDETFGHGDAWATAPDGTLYDVDLDATLVNGTWQYAVQRTVYATGWQGTTNLVGAYPYLYRFTAAGLERSPYYTPNAAGEAVVGQWSDVVDAVLVDSTRVNDAYVSSTFYVVRTSGALDQVVIGNEPGAVPVVTTIKSTGFADVVDLARGGCNNSAYPNGLPLLGITSGGSALVWFDQDATNSSGADLTGGSGPVATRWKDTFFGQ